MIQEGARLMIKGSVGMVKTQYYHHQAPLVLESGESLVSLTVVYETDGSLNRDASNAVLLCHALSGDAHVAGYHKGEKRAGWWDAVVGPGQGFRHEPIFCHLLEHHRRVAKVQPAPRPSNPATGKPYGDHISGHHNQGHGQCPETAY